ncbi:hypothetical protein [Streptomyces lavenduligriseus]|uniref:Uncharacterized protein n=1 Tax=Streptomyces lavenduligriseus TaxID=67315 RepID=A0ABT0P390_9ACTN|nr:hypothetical protein [Streptomyces lavenduligriseus]MCL3998204.1 hypothetical protein [Streptomyces lavenduligriseus]
MHDPATPDPHPAPDRAGGQPPDDDLDGAADHEVAVELVGQVIAWYSQRIFAARRAGASPQALNDLIAQRLECVRDRDRLDTADPQETARLAALYAARLKELQNSGS